MKAIHVPSEFIFRDHYPYPQDNLPYDFEFYLIGEILLAKHSVERIFIPVTWTAYLKLHKYGEDKAAIQKLQNFINTIDKSKKYWTYVQFDLGTMIDWTGIDVKLFSSAGGRVDYPMPLLCQKHKPSFTGIKKDILCSFVGRDTHPVRNNIFRQLSGLKEYIITQGHYDMHHYCNILARSVFALVPRGFSANSFRLAEALQYGAIPIYISDDIYHFPHERYINFEYGITLSEHSIEKIPYLLSSMSPELIEMKQSLLNQTYESYFTFESNMSLIIKELEMEIHEPKMPF